MQLNPAEISELIKSRIEGLQASADIKNQGTVVSVTDGICRVHGLSDVMAGEMLEFPATKSGQPTFGLALNLERDSVGAGLQAFDTALDQLGNFSGVQLHGVLLASGRRCASGGAGWPPQAVSATFICSRRALTEVSRTSSPTTTRMPPMRSGRTTTLASSLRRKRCSSVATTSGSWAASIG